MRNTRTDRRARPELPGGAPSAPSPFCHPLSRCPSHHCSSASRLSTLPGALQAATQASGPPTSVHTLSVLARPSRLNTGGRSSVGRKAAQADARSAALLRAGSVGRPSAAASQVGQKTAALGRCLKAGATARIIPRPAGKHTAFALCFRCLRDQDTAFALRIRCLRG